MKFILLVFSLLGATNGFSQIIGLEEYIGKPIEELPTWVQDSLQRCSEVYTSEKDPVDMYMTYESFYFNDSIQSTLNIKIYEKNNQIQRIGLYESLALKNSDDSYLLNKITNEVSEKKFPN